MRKGWRRRAALVGVATITIGYLMAAQPAQAAPKCFGKKADIVGTPDNDSIKGTSGNDVIVALDGRDRISGRGGNDRICAGDGFDLLRGRAGNDLLGGGDGGDLLLGQKGNDELVGGKGRDSLIGSVGNDQMVGGEGSEFMQGALGDDVYNGGPGSFDLASFFASPVGVTVDLGNPAPQATGEGTDTVIGVEGAEGTDFNDILKGQDIASATGNGLFGLGGVDQVLGLDGNDVVIGGGGSDEGALAPGNLNGGAGNDEVFGDEPGFFRLGPAFLSGDDDLYGEAGDDLLDGGGNVTGPPAGDFGDGGPHVAGDQCAGLEAAVECEIFFRPASRGVRIGGSEGLSAWHAFRPGRMAG